MTVVALGYTCRIQDYFSTVAATHFINETWINTFFIIHHVYSYFLQAIIKKSCSTRIIMVRYYLIYLEWTRLR